MRLADVENALDSAVFAVRRYKAVHGLPLRLRLKAARAVRMIADSAHVLACDDCIMRDEVIAHVCESERL